MGCGASSLISIFGGFDIVRLTCPWNRRCCGGHLMNLPCPLLRQAKLLLCDGCDRGTHFYCLTPPLHRLPDGGVGVCLVGCGVRTRRVRGFGVVVIVPWLVCFLNDAAHRARQHAHDFMLVLYFSWCFSALLFVFCSILAFQINRSAFRKLPVCVENYAFLSPFFFFPPTQFRRMALRHLHGRPIVRRSIPCIPRSVT